MKWYTNRKIKKTLINGFLLISVIAAIVGGFGILTIAQMRNSAQRMYNESALSLQYAGMAAMKTQNAYSSALSLSTLDIKKDKSTIMTVTADLTKALDEVDKNLKNLGGSLSVKEKDALLKDVNSNWEDLKKVSELC